MSYQIFNEASLGKFIELIQNKVRSTSYNAATVVQTSLSSGGWSGGKYSFETQYPTNKYDITVEPDGDKITAEGYKAWGALKPTGSINNVLIAKGKIPAVDIAVILRVVEKNA